MFHDVRFCDICHLQLQDTEVNRCEQCKKNPLWSITKYYEKKEDRELRQELLDTDHDCRKPGPCTFCSDVMTATHDELVKMKGKKYELQNN